jgi:hypothetical protein
MDLNSLQFGYQDNHPFHTVTAHTPDGTQVGAIDWVKSNKRAAASAGMQPGEVSGVWANPQREGIGTALWNQARQKDPKIQHSESQTPSGASWAANNG